MLKITQDKLISFLINSPKKSISFGIITFITLLSGIQYITTDFTPKMWFSNKSKQIEELNTFERRFGGDQSIILGYYTKDSIFTEKILKKITDITDELWLLPDVIRVDSLSNSNHIKNLGNDIEISPLIEDPRQIAIIEENIKSLSQLKNSLISANYKFIIFIAQLKPVFNKSPNYDEFIGKFNQMIKQFENDRNRFISLGNVSLTSAFQKISETDNTRIIPILFLLIFLILSISFRSILGVLAPLLISGITIGSTFGIMGLMTKQFNSILAAIPGILIAICLADTVHILSSFYHRKDKGDDTKTAMKKALEDNYLATILTTITTGISFYTISFTDLIPIHDLGILAAIGTVLAWINTYIFLPTLIISLPEKLSHRFFKNIFTQTHFDFSSFIWKFRYIIITSFVTLSFGSFYIALGNEVNSDPLKYFSEETKIKRDYMFTKKFFPGIRGIEIQIDSGTEGGVKSPHFLTRVDSYTKELLKDDNIIQVSSIIDTLMQINMQINNGDPEYNKIPETREQIAEAIVLYSMGLPPNQGLENILSLDNRYMKLKLKWNIETTTEGMKKNNEIHALAKKYDLKTKTGGFFPIYTQVNDKVVDSFFRSMTMAILLVSIIILVIFKNPFLSFLAMLPNIIPLTFGAAYMALNNIYIDIGTSIVAAICLGIAVDDTIHFLAHFVKNYNKYQDVDKALNNTYRSTGKALILTTILLVMGFGSFVLAEFLPNHYFGVLCAIVLTFALLTDLLFLPALLSIKYKKSRYN